ncbi:GNAT family N-acetyltransferase [Streptococcus oralis]|uniref:Acetyltransferase, GNAT family n=2 Tax=Streptococcus oralis TaxID=1303 RepID=E6KNF8_STROR|nr:GNAT family N-acetyltransferase [Streptococcus oralis]EFU62525.1 acetyltransferase, GNAT family [Streptococcus oralis ATCC 49296]ORO49664.1 GNAT family N-acetyltransferase [Streptococcus oralis subsp. oralis]ORO67799.1 GNAT family N-acetyltransferase [Streptococcus oralis subsp. oralis]ORO72695.1 GNAT family N-acetyltransferase [Streptococcus oralis subsp. oralis]
MEIPITIRQATLSDLDEMLAIEEANFSSEEAVSRQSLEECIRKSVGTFLVARDENQLVGYILGEVQSHPKWIEIKSLTIHPDHWGQGLGTLLLAALKQVTVELNHQGILLQSPDELLSYFEMNGFVEEEITESHYGSGSEWYLIWANPFYQEEK